MNNCITITYIHVIDLSIETEGFSEEIYKFIPKYDREKLLIGCPNFEVPVFKHFPNYKKVSPATKTL